LTVEYEDGVEIDQVKILLGDDTTARLPLGGDPSMRSGSRFVLVLDDELGGQELDLVVWGLKESVGQLCRDLGHISIERHETNEVDVQLESSAPSPCGNAQSILGTDCTCLPVGLPDGCAAWEGWGPPTDPNAVTDCEPVLPSNLTDTGMWVIGHDQPQIVCGVPANATVDCNDAEVEAAIRGAVNDQTIVLQSGCSYGPVEITKPITLRGRCDGNQTKIASTDDGPAIEVTAEDGHVILRGLTVDNCASGGILVTGAADVTIQDMDLNNCEGSGIEMSGGGTLTVDHSVIRNIDGPGLQILGGTSHTLNQVAVHNAEPGIHIENAGTGTTLTSCVLAFNRAQGMRIERSTVSVTGSVVRDSGAPSAQPPGLAGLGEGIAVRDNSTLNIDHSLLAMNRSTGVLVTDSDLTVQTSIVRHTQPDVFDDSHGTGILAIGTSPAPASVTVKESVIAQNRTAGILASSTCTVIDRTLIQGTNHQSCDGEYGDALVILSEDPPECGLPPMCGARVADYSCDGDYDLVLTRSKFERNAGAAAHFFCGATGSLRDCLVTGGSRVADDGADESAGDSEVRNCQIATGVQP